MIKWYHEIERRGITPLRSGLWEPRTPHDPLAALGLGRGWWIISKNNGGGDVPNKENLVQNKKRTPSERRKSAQKAGKASGEARRQKKTLRENMSLLLSLDLTDAGEIRALSEMGIPSTDINNAMLLTAALFQRAKTGDVAACREVREWLGEQTEENGEVLIVDDIPKGAV